MRATCLVGITYSRVPYRFGASRNLSQLASTTLQLVLPRRFPAVIHTRPPPPAIPTAVGNTTVAKKTFLLT